MRFLASANPTTVSKNLPLRGVPYQMSKVGFFIFVVRDGSTT
jgi:hypothetical protein